MLYRHGQHTLTWPQLLGSLTKHTSCSEVVRRKQVSKQARSDGKWIPVQTPSCPGPLFVTAGGQKVSVAAWLTAVQDASFAPHRVISRTRINASHIRKGLGRPCLTEVACLFEVLHVIHSRKYYKLYIKQETKSDPILPVTRCSMRLSPWKTWFASKNIA